jgi:hypothetical protein
MVLRMQRDAALAVLLSPQVLSSLQDALLRKLDEARQLLLQTPAAQGEQMGQQLQLVQQLLQTLETTKQGMQQ